MPKITMLKALAIKELRESVGLMALGILCAIGIAGPLMGITVVPGVSAHEGWYPFVNRVHLWDQGLILGVLAFAFGLKQTMLESHQGTFRFLLHRPLSRNTVFLIKLLVGASAFLAVNAFMILLLGCWSARTGNHPSPFSWSMTLPTCELGVALLLVYLGGFLSGVRPAKWFGTRLVPGAFAAACVYVIATSQWWWYSLAIGLSSAAAMLIAIFYYVRTSDQ